MLVPRREEYEKVEALFTILDLKRNNCFSQVAVEAAYSDGEAWLESMIDYVKGNMDYVRKYCQEHIPQLIPNEPEGTYLIWMDCRELGLNDEDLANFMINEAKIALNPGTAFGEEGSGYVRLNLACPRSAVIEAMQSLKEAVQTIITKE
ncbi:pyridoxal phosphate-dependent aminotransferase, partial [Aduncisulcus paluster]